MLLRRPRSSNILSVRSNPCYERVVPTWPEYIKHSTLVHSKFPRDTGLTFPRSLGPACCTVVAAACYRVLRRPVESTPLGSHSVDLPRLTPLTRGINRGVAHSYPLSLVRSLCLHLSILSVSLCSQLSLSHALLI